MYRAIGPAATALGVGLLFGAAVYYYCYGMPDEKPSRHKAQDSERSRRSGRDGSHERQSPNSPHEHHHHHSHRHRHYHQGDGEDMQDSVDIALQGDEAGVPLTGGFRTDQVVVNITEPPEDNNQPTETLINGHVQSVNRVEYSKDV